MKRQWAVVGAAGITLAAGLVWFAARPRTIPYDTRTPPGTHGQPVTTAPGGPSMPQESAAPFAASTSAMTPGDSAASSDRLSSLPAEARERVATLAAAASTPDAAALAHTIATGLAAYGQPNAGAFLDWLAAQGVNPPTDWESPSARALGWRDFRASWGAMALDPARAEVHCRLDAGRDIGAERWSGWSVGTASRDDARPGLSSIRPESMESWEVIFPALVRRSGGAAEAVHLGFEFLRTPAGPAPWMLYRVRTYRPAPPKGPGGGFVGGIPL